MNAKPSPRIHSRFSSVKRAKATQLSYPHRTDTSDAKSMSASSCFLWLPLRGSGTDITHSTMDFTYASRLAVEKSKTPP